MCPPPCGSTLGGAGGTSGIASSTPHPVVAYTRIDPCMERKVWPAQPKHNLESQTSPRAPGRGWGVSAKGPLACNAACLFPLLSPASFFFFLLLMLKQEHAFIIILQAVSQNFLLRNPTCNTIFKRKKKCNLPILVHALPRKIQKTPVWDKRTAWPV